jgi:hypothetical protein
MKSNIYYIYDYIYEICKNAIYSHETTIYAEYVSFHNLCLYTFIKKKNYYKIYLLIVVC